MGVVIKGPAHWWNKKTGASPEVPVSETPVQKSSGRCVDYPWHTLTAPPGTKSGEYQDTVAQLKHLVMLAGDSGGILMLPEGWFWDPKKNQDLISQLFKIAEASDAESVSESEEIPDDIA